MSNVEKIYDPEGSGKYILKIPDHKGLYWHGVNLFGTINAAFQISQRVHDNPELEAWDETTHDDQYMMVVWHKRTGNYYVHVSGESLL